MPSLLDIPLLKELAENLPQAQPPEVLWHYTTVSAARDILKDRSLRLSCHAFMNDTSEGTVPGAIVSAAWVAACDEASSHPRLHLAAIRDLADVRPYFDFGRSELPPTFLFSLTELHDSLSQWSRYGDNGAGLALGFKITPAALPQAPQNAWATATRLARVHYDDPAPGADARVRLVVHQLLAKYLPLFESPTSISNTLIALTHVLNPIVKAGPYSEEREWRITTRTVIESSTLYDLCSNRHGIVPYVPLPLGQGVELVELMVGPKLPADNEWSAKWLCKKFGHAAKVSRSQLAYR